MSAFGLANLINTCNIRLYYIDETDESSIAILLIDFALFFTFAQPAI